MKKALLVIAAIIGMTAGTASAADDVTVTYDTSYAHMTVNRSGCNSISKKTGNWVNVGPARTMLSSDGKVAVVTSAGEAFGMNFEIEDDTMRQFILSQASEFKTVCALAMKSAGF